MKQVRISVAGLMALVAIIAIDIAVIPPLGHVQSASTRLGLFTVLVMAHILAVYLVIVVSSLVRGSEVALSPIMFLLFGGAGMVVLVYLADLAPHFFWSYLHNTAGLLKGPNRGVGVPRRSGMALIEPLVDCGVLTLSLLVPGLLAAWTARGYRLQLLEGPDAAGAAEQPSADQLRGSH